MEDILDDSINLRALKKIDDNIQEIQVSAGQVAIYFFDSEDTVWKRKDIEGPLFFVKRSAHPQYAFVVINRLNTINLVQKINKEVETNLQTPYLLYKNAENEIYCVWFYDKENSVILNQKITETIEMMKQQTFSQPMMNQFNRLSFNSSNSAPSQSDLLKKILSVDNNKPDQEIHKPIQAPIPQELMKPVAQRRSVKVQDLFGNSLNSSAEASTPIKLVNDIQNVKSVEKPPMNSFEEHPFNKLAGLNIPNAERVNDKLNSFNANSPLLGAFLDKLAPSNSTPANSKTPVTASFLERLPPNSFDSSLHEPRSIQQNDGDKPMYLSMEQLKKTLIYLLQNNADFLHMIHTAYVSEIRK